MSQADKLASEIASFEGIWQSGYYEGDPLDPLAKSTYGSYGYISVLYATYLYCIRPYISPATVALEIGPGRGAWTRAMLGAKEVWALDALSAEYNGFFEYVGRHDHVRYLQVSDFECRDLPDGHFDFMFSFGCLCHVTFDGIEAYAQNLFPKLTSGAECFWLVADKRKYDEFVREGERYDIWKSLAPARGSLSPVKGVFDAISSYKRPAFTKFDPFAGGQGSWYDAGVERTCEMLRGVGYEIVSEDIGTVPRDPIIHFRKG